MSNQEAITKLGTLKSHAAQLKYAVYDAWKKAHIGTGTPGLILDPKALAGAKQAMNDKYGAGSVEW